MLNKSRAAALGLLVAFTLPSARAEAQAEPAPAAPTAQAKSEASTRFKKGTELFSEGDFRAALVEFQRAYELAPNYQVLYNIGQVSYQLREYADALNALQAYLNQGGERISAKRRGEVTQDIAKLQTRVGKVSVSSNVAGAEVLIDDISVGTTPLPAPLLVSAGRHKITLAPAQGARLSRVVELASGDTQEVRLDVEAPAAPSEDYPPAALAPTSDSVERPDGDAPPAPAAPASERRSPGWAIAGWSLTGALAAGAAVTGVLALGASSDLDVLRATRGATRLDLDAAGAKTGDLALACDILGGAAIVAGGVSLYLTLSNGSSAPSSVSVGAAPGGLRVSGSF